MKAAGQLISVPSLKQLWCSYLLFCTIWDDTKKYYLQVKFIFWKSSWTYFTTIMNRQCIYKSNNHIGSVTDKAKKDSITGHHWTGWYGATAALTADYLLLYCYTPLHNLSWLRWLSVHDYWLWFCSYIHLQCRRNDKNHSPSTKIAGCFHQAFFTTNEKRLSVYGKKK